ncbi:MAG: YafY family protein [Hyphomicrobiales bacterium]
MSKSERLLALLQILRRHRNPVSGADLAAELGVSLRTLYRYIADLEAQGADIVGEAGVGYVLRPGFLLPPLMFDVEEVEALTLGLRWVVDRGDERLARAAGDALVKIETVLPAAARVAIEAGSLIPGPVALEADAVEVATIRKAIREERKLEIAYRDAGATPSRRTIWPIAIGYFEAVRVVVAWCELREDFRHFRTDRIVELAETGVRYGKRRVTLLGQWEKSQTNTGIVGGRLT